MRTSWRLGLAVMISTASAPVFAQQATGAAPLTLDATHVLQSVQDFYNRTSDFEADFAQTSRQALTGTTEQRNGHVRFRKPGRMRWDYASPRGDVIVSDGTTVRAYEAAAHQVFQTTLSQSQLPSALSFLTGVGNLAHDFTPQLLDPDHRTVPNFYVLELTPTQPSPSFSHIVFYVVPGSFQVARTVVMDAQNNSNRFDFTNPHVNMNIPDSVFQWQPPAGTQVVRP